MPATVAGALVRITARLSRWLLILAAGWAFAVCFVVVADIVGRNLLGSPLKGTPEMVAASIVIITFLQAGYAIRSGSMLSATFVVDRLGPRLRQGSRVLAYLLGAFFFAMVALGAWDFAVHSWVHGEYEGEGSLRIPSWPARGVILVGASLGAVNYLVMACLEALGVSDPTPEGSSRPPTPL